MSDFGARTDDVLPVLLYGTKLRWATVRARCLVAEGPKGAWIIAENVRQPVGEFLIAAWNAKPPQRADP